MSITFAKTKGTSSTQKRLEIIKGNTEGHYLYL